MNQEHWVAIALAAIVAFGLIKRWLNPPKPLNWADVPQNLRELFEASVPGFEVTGVRHRRHGFEYKLNGRYRGREAKAEIEFDRAGQAREIEVDDLHAGIFGRAGACEWSDLPPEVIAHLEGLLGDERSSFQITEMFHATCGGSPGHGIRGNSAGWRWKFEFLADGMLVELEKEPAR